MMECLQSQKSHPSKFKIRSLLVKKPLEIKKKHFWLGENLVKKKPLVAYARRPCYCFEEKKMGSVEASLLEASYKQPKHVMPYDNMVKSTLSNWKQIKKDKLREAARLQLEQIKNSTGFEDNMDAMRDFEDLIGNSMSYPIYT